MSTRTPTGDHTITPRALLVSGMAVAVGAAATVTAVVLLDLIALATNLFFYGRFSLAASSPADHTLGPWVVLLPVLGGLLVGAMARFGSEKIRGHGIPEAMEAILLRGSRVEPKVALLKPISAAISIGSGGPFGAEGPIIMTGGAVGSLLAQTLHLTAAERKTLLVAGAAAGMSAVFGTPLAAVLLGVELLLFEWKPRSLVPVALAAATAAALRPVLVGSGALFTVPARAVPLDAAVVLGCVLVGLSAGALSGVLSRAIYAVEDLFAHLPVHWMWWPAIGGLVVGLGGWIDPRVLGVGYPNIAGLLDGSIAGQAVIALVVVKAVVWIASLGTGTSGGVLAPLLTIGAGLGALEAGFLPEAGPGFWALLSMAAALGGTMRCPLAAVLFAMEVTHDFDALVPLLVAVTASYLVTTLTLRRSILTEKIARRGVHVSHEYAIDPLEIRFVRDVMRAGAAEPHEPGAPAAFSDDILRVVVNRMAASGRTRLPVLDPDAPGTVVGVVTLEDLLQARAHGLVEEEHRERLLWPAVGGARG